MAGWDCDAGEGPQISGKPGVRAPRLPAAGQAHRDGSGAAWSRAVSVT